MDTIRICSRKKNVSEIYKAYDHDFLGNSLTDFGLG